MSATAGIYAAVGTGIMMAWLIWYSDSLYEKYTNQYMHVGLFTNDNIIALDRDINSSVYWANASIIILYMFVGAACYILVASIIHSLRDGQDFMKFIARSSARGKLNGFIQLCAGIVVRGIGLGMIFAITKVVALCLPYIIIATHAARSPWYLAVGITLIGMTIAWIVVQLATIALRLIALRVRVFS